MSEVKTEHAGRANVFFTLPQHLVELLEEEADKEKRSRNAQLEVVLEARYRDFQVIAKPTNKPRRNRRAV